MSKSKKKEMDVRSKFTESQLNELADSLRKWIDRASFNHEMFLFGDWCFNNQFCTKDFKKYIDRHEKFSEAYRYAKDYQAYIICRKALTKELDPRFAQFMLICNHDWESPKERAARQSEIPQLGQYFQAFDDHMKKEYKDQNKEEKESPIDNEGG